MLNQLLIEVKRKLDAKSKVDDKTLREIIANTIIGFSEFANISYSEKIKLLDRCFAEIRQYGVLQELIESKEISEIMVNGLDEIFVEKNGVIIQSGLRFESEERLNYVIQKIVTEAGRVVNTMSPIVDARLENGDRVNVVLKPLAINGPILTIRKFQNGKFTLEKLVENGSLSECAKDEIIKLVNSKFNIFIAGGTGSGKTTLLNALSSKIGADERIISIEDSAELMLDNLDNWVRLETRNKNSEGVGEITMSDLIKTSLRMRPDRIIVGEVRGGEAVDMLQAMNTGHDGSISTGHANSTRDMLSRIETMVLSKMEIPLMAVKSQINSAIDIIVYVSRFRDGSRRVASITALDDLVDGSYKLVEIYKFVENEYSQDGRVSGQLVRTENPYPRVKKFYENQVAVKGGFLC